MCKFGKNVSKCSFVESLGTVFLYKFAFLKTDLGNYAFAQILKGILIVKLLFMFPVRFGQVRICSNQFGKEQACPKLQLFCPNVKTNLICIHSSQMLFV